MGVLPDVSTEKMNKIVAVKCQIDMDLPAYLQRDTDVINDEMVC